MNYLDLRRLPKVEVAERGPALANQLRVVLDNTVYDLGAISDEPEGRPEAGLPRNRQLIGRVETDKGTFSMYLERVPRDDGVMIWQFSNVTVSRIPDLYRDLTYGIVGERLPPFLVETRVLRLALWQWIGLVVLLGVSALTAVLVVRPGLPLTRRIAIRTGFDVTDPTFGKALAPLRGLVGLIAFKIGESGLALPVVVQPVIIGILGPSSLDVELFVYVRTRDANDYLAVREDLCLRMMDIVSAAGTAFALPAQTNYNGATGLDVERAGAAAAEVRRWRNEGKLPLPEFPLKTRS